MAESKYPDPPTSQTVGGATIMDTVSSFVGEIFSSPLNLALVGIIAILVYKIIKSQTKQYEPPYEVKELPKLRRDFTVEELKEYNGTGPDGRILVAVNGNVYDVTKGARFYGPGKFNIYK